MTSRVRCSVASRRRCGSHREWSEVTLPFPSGEWVKAYGAAINASESYHVASTEWTHSADALVVDRQPEIGIAEAVGLSLGLDRGTCREAKRVCQTEAEHAPSAIPMAYGQVKRGVHQAGGTD